MLQNTSKTIGFQKIMVYKTPPGGGGKLYLARGLLEERRDKFILANFHNTDFNSWGHSGLNVIRKVSYST